LPRLRRNSDQPELSAAAVDDRRTLSAPCLLPDLIVPVCTVDTWPIPTVRTGRSRTTPDRSRRPETTHAFGVVRQARCLIDGHPQSSKGRLVRSLRAQRSRCADANPKLIGGKGRVHHLGRGAAVNGTGLQTVDRLLRRGQRIPTLSLSPSSTGGKVYHNLRDDHVR